MTLSLLLYQPLSQGSAGSRGFPGWPGLKGEKGTRGTTGGQGLRGPLGRRVESFAVLRVHLLVFCREEQEYLVHLDHQEERYRSLCISVFHNKLTFTGSTRITWSAWWSWFTRYKGRKRTTRFSRFHWRSG